MAKSEPTFRMEEKGSDWRDVVAVYPDEGPYHLIIRGERIVLLGDSVHVHDRQPELEETLFEIGETLVGDPETHALLDPEANARRAATARSSPTLDDLFGDDDLEMHPADREALEEMGAGKLRAAVEDVDLRAPAEYLGRLDGNGPEEWECGRTDCLGSLVPTNMTRHLERTGGAEILVSDNVAPTGRIHACGECGALYERVERTDDEDPEMWRRADLEGAE